MLERLKRFEEAAARYEKASDRTSAFAAPAKSNPKPASFPYQASA